jgi:hypothetical protein
MGRDRNRSYFLQVTGLKHKVPTIHFAIHFVIAILHGLTDFLLQFGMAARGQVNCSVLSEQLHCYSFFTQFTTKIRVSDAN